MQADSQCTHMRLCAAVEIRSIPSMLAVCFILFTFSYLLSLLHSIVLSDAAILSQRFLESEGELGRAFSRVLAKFTDLQVALAHAQKQAVLAAQQDSAV